MRRRSQSIRRTATAPADAPQTQSAPLWSERPGKHFDPYRLGELCLQA